MKISSVLSVLSVSVIATSTLINSSTAALAVSQPTNISTNIELNSSQISVQSSLMVAAEDGEKNEPSRVVCPPPFVLLGLCGWW
ncbi:MAG: hypothetical protein DCE90_18825 [Pseudanabaena sp.]|nr:MAG: hypothetical protein DCE90_18825 [Pseudanabaena sp.]